MWIAFHNPFKLAFARRAKAINLKQSNPKGELRAFSCRRGSWNECDLRFVFFTCILTYIFRRQNAQNVHTSKRIAQTHIKKHSKNERAFLTCVCAMLFDVSPRACVVHTLAAP